MGEEEAEDLFDLWLKKYTLLVIQVKNEWCHEKIDVKEVSEKHMKLPLCLEFRQLLVRTTFRQYVDLLFLHSSFNGKHDLLNMKEYFFKN